MNLSKSFTLVTLCLSLIFMVPVAASAQSFEIATDSTGKAYVLMPDGTKDYRHPMIKEVGGRQYMRSVAAAEAEAKADADGLQWQAYAVQGRRQMAGSRICFAGAILVPGIVYLAPLDLERRALLGGGVGLFLGLLGLGLDAAAHNNHHRSIHLHIDARGGGIGIPLE